MDRARAARIMRLRVGPGDATLLWETRVSLGLAIKDFFAWLGEMLGGGETRAPAAVALGVRDGAPVRLRWSGAGYDVERAAAAGDAGPLFLDDSQALGAAFETSEEAALHGADGARIEAAKRCPFPLESAAWRLSRAPQPWRAGAPWRLVAIQTTRLASITQALRAVGARPGATFAFVDGAPVALTPTRGARLPAAFGLGALLLAAAGAISIEIGAGRIEAAAEARLAAARAALDQAEAAANDAATRREAEAAPIEAARAGDALLAAAPAAGRALSALAAALDDTAHARRLRISPGAIEAEIVAPDAAALAAEIGAAPAFRSARLKTAAQVDATSGLQRAVLDIAPMRAQ